MEIAVNLLTFALLAAALLPLPSIAKDTPLEVRHIFVNMPLSSDFHLFSSKSFFELQIDYAEAQSPENISGTAYAVVHENPKTHLWENAVASKDRPTVGKGEAVLRGKALESWKDATTGKTRVFMEYGIESLKLPDQTVIDVSKNTVELKINPSGKAEIFRIFNDNGCVYDASDPGHRFEVKPGKQPDFSISESN